MKFLRKFNTRKEYENFYLTTTDYPNLCLINDEKCVEYNIISPMYYPLCVEAIEDINVSFGNTYEYSKDNNTWTSGNSDTIISAIAGEKVYFRSIGLSASESNGIGKFIISGGFCNISGNIMSMVYGADFSDNTVMNSYQFSSLFKGSEKIVNANRLVLPANNAINSCYQGMFEGCTSLVTAPALPATSVGSYGYAGMFKGCTSLTTSPVLPAKHISSGCYQYMFDGCTSLNYIKAMFLDIGQMSPTLCWLRGVSSTGTFVKNSNATWDKTGSDGVPNGWTVVLEDD